MTEREGRNLRLALKETARESVNAWLSPMRRLLGCASL